VYKLPCFIPAPTVKWPSKLKKHLPENIQVPETPEPLLLKHRFPKQYRHPILDANLTKSRIQAEARALARCARAGIAVPGVRLVDLETGILGMEWIEGYSVREMLGGGAEGEDDEETDDENDESVAFEKLSLEEKQEINSRKERASLKLKRLQEAEGALERLGVSQGPSVRSQSVFSHSLTVSCRGPYAIHRYRLGQDARQHDSTWRSDDVQHDAPSSSRPESKL
jgi:hypothetical protein